MKENVINYIPLKIYRYFRWLNNEKKIYRYNKNNFSKEYAKICFHADDILRRQCSLKEILTAYERKDEYIINYLENLCSDVIEKYKKGYRPVKRNLNEKKIWVFWWTGEKAAPEIVKVCMKSIRRNASGHEVIVLDQDNYMEYVSFPKFILNKHDAGQITHAAFADLLRLNLLSSYGGVWIDATVFVSQPLAEEVFVSEFYTLRTTNMNTPYFSHSRWCGYFLAGDADFLLYSFAYDFMLEYWDKSEQIIEYLLMDYTFGIAHKNFDEVRMVIDRMPDNNFKRGKLMSVINEPYNESLFLELATQETFASKLSWRYGNPVPITKNGEMTNYGYLLGL